MVIWAVCIRVGVEKGASVIVYTTRGGAMMNLALKEGESLESKVTVILTQRDMLLLKLCLELVGRNYTKSGALRFDIQSLRDKLPHQFGESR